MLCAKTNRSIGVGVGIVFIVAVASLAATWGILVGSEDAEPAQRKTVIDFATLGLKVTGVRCEKKITGLGRKGGASAVPGDDEKLVVISLAGKAETDINPFCVPGQFFVFYEELTLMPVGYAIPMNRVRQCAAVRFGKEGRWTVADPALLGTTGFMSKGPVTIEVAAMVPADVKKVSVLIPTFAAGSGAVPDASSPGLR